MSHRARMIVEKRSLVAKVHQLKPGTRMLCRENGKVYQLGAKHGLSQFWMLQETPPQKGLVDARTICDRFEVIA